METANLFSIIYWDLSLWEIEGKEKLRCQIIEESRITIFLIKLVGSNLKTVALWLIVSKGD